MTILQEADRIAREQVSKGNHIGECSVEEFSEKPHFKAHTNLKTKDIQIKLNPEYEVKHPGKTALVVRDAAKHEINHHKYGELVGCPGNLETDEKSFFEPMFSVLSKKGFSETDVNYATNALEDSILHLDLRQGNHNLEGIALFFENQGESDKTKRKFKRLTNDKEEEIEMEGKFTPFYEAHVKLNMFLFGNKQQKRKVQRFYAHDSRVKGVLERFLEKTGNLNFLDKTNWGEISRIYAEEFSELMTPGYAMPLINNSGQGTKGREIPGESGKQSDEGNVFTRTRKTKGYRKSRARKSYKTNEPLPEWFDKTESLDFIYQSLAEDFDIIAKNTTESKQMPIAYFGQRPFDEKRDDLKRARFGFNEKGDIELKKPKYEETAPIPVKKDPQGFPETRWNVLDCSISMKYNSNTEQDREGNPINVGSTKVIPWGDESRYHYALLSQWSFYDFLERNHLLHNSEMSLGHFSDRTNIVKGLRAVKEAALNPTFGRSTKIDETNLDDFFGQKGSLVLTISDGEIQNWSDIKKDFIEKAQTQQYFHFQIGSSNEMTRDLEKNGIRVEYVTRAEDLRGKTIDLMEDLYKRAM